MSFRQLNLGVLADVNVTHHKWIWDFVTGSPKWDVENNCCNPPEQKAKVLEAIFQEMRPQTAEQCIRGYVNEQYLSTEEGRLALVMFCQELVIFQAGYGRGKRNCKGRQTTTLSNNEMV